MNSNQNKNINPGNLDIASMMKLLSQMDKKQLEEGIGKANQILKSKDKNAIVEEIKKNMK
ncbi:MAG: hypothetical protein ACLU8F_00635 [Clostridia bacterium]